MYSFLTFLFPSLNEQFFALEISRFGVLVLLILTSHWMVIQKVSIVLITSLVVTGHI